MMKTLAPVMVALSLIGSAASAASFVNGSFENGINPGKSTLLVGGDTTSLPGWQVIGGNIDLVGTAWQAADGVRSIDLSGTGPGGVSQTLTGLTVGAKYRVSFDLSGSDAGVRTMANHMSVSATGNASQYYSYDLPNVVSDMMYRPSFYTFVARSGSTAISFRGLDAGNYGAVLDNVALKSPSGATQSVPEPATWALMIAGFAMTGMVKRRRPAVLAN